MSNISYKHFSQIISPPLLPSRTLNVLEAFLTLLNPLSLPQDYEYIICLWVAFKKTQSKKTVCMNIVKNRHSYELQIIAKEISKGGLSVPFLHGQSE